MNNLKTGWLSPFGEFCPTVKNGYTAEKIAKEKFNFEGEHIIATHDFLLKHGYVYITTSVFSEYCWCIHWDFKKHLTNVQKEFLKPYFEDTNFAMHSESKIMWEYEHNE